jgi:hypothetical protein
VRVIHKDNEGLCLTMNLGFAKHAAAMWPGLIRMISAPPTGLRFNIPISRVTATVDVVFSHTHKFGDKQVWRNPDKMSGAPRRGRS